MVWNCGKRTAIELAEQMTETFEKNQAFIANRFANGLASSLENDLATSALASSRRRKLCVREYGMHR